MQNFEIECKDLNLKMIAAFLTRSERIIMQILEDHIEACHFQPMKLLSAEHVNGHENLKTAWRKLLYTYY